MHSGGALIKKSALNEVVQYVSNARTEADILADVKMKHTSENVQICLVRIHFQFNKLKYYSFSDYVTRKCVSGLHHPAGCKESTNEYNKVSIKYILLFLKIFNV